MKKLFLTIFIMSFIILNISCTESTETLNLKFEGESQNWSAVSTEQYKIKRTADKNERLGYSNSGSTVFTLKYKDSESESFRVSYKLIIPSGSSESEATLFNGVLKTKSEFQNGTVPKKDDTYTLKINWNGQEETIKLINKAN